MQIVCVVGVPKFLKPRFTCLRTDYNMKRGSFRTHDDYARSPAADLMGAGLRDIPQYIWVPDGLMLRRP
jgi:hypothetical protein